MKNMMFVVFAVVALIAVPDLAVATNGNNAFFVSSNGGNGNTRVRVKSNGGAFRRADRTTVRSNGNAAVQVNTASNFNPNFNRNFNQNFNRNFNPSGVNINVNGNNSSRFNSFGTRTVVDRNGNVFEQDAFGNVQFKGNAFGNRSSVSFNRNFSSHGFNGNNVTVLRSSGCR